MVPRRRSASYSGRGGSPQWIYVEHVTDSPRSVTLVRPTAVAVAVAPRKRLLIADAVVGRAASLTADAWGETGRGRRALRCHRGVRRRSVERREAADDAE